MAPLKLLTIFNLTILYVLGCFAQSDTAWKSASLPITDFYLTGLSERNPAATAFISKSHVKISFENRFFLKELMKESVRGTIRYGPNTFLVSVDHFGYSRYGELTTELGYVRNFGQRIAIGMQFYYLMSHAAEYPMTHSVTFDISLYAAISNNIGLGFSVYNPARLKYNMTGRTVLPTRLHLDFNYRIGKKVILFTEVEKELKSQFVFRLGAGYKVRCLYLSVSAQIPEPQIDIETEIAYRRFVFGITWQYRILLGFVPQASMVLRL